jgi:phage replication O-like protein O
MASPQLENGYTRISNEILEATAAARLNGTQYAVILCVWRQTYGYQRKAHSLSESFITKATGMSRRGIQIAINELIQRNILTVTREPTFNTPREIAFQKDYTQWRTTLPQVQNTSTGEENYAPPGEQSCAPPGEQSCAQRKIVKDKVKILTSDKASNEPFDMFWAAYPKRQAKQDALKAFTKLKPDESLLTAILAAVQRQAASEEWQRDNGRYVPMPATYLRGRRWEDENTGQQAEPLPKRKLLNDFNEGNAT